jgi:hypothetical protein
MVDDLLSDGGISAQGSYSYNASGTERRSSRPNEMPFGLGKAWLASAFSSPVPSPSPSFGSQWPAVSEGAVVAPSDMIAVADWFDGIVTLDIPHTNRIGSFYPSSIIAPWHRVGDNVLFTDGHVQQLTRKKLYDATDEARRRFNNDHESHPETWPDKP